MNILNHKIICPFCFTSSGPQDIVFRCLYLTCPGRAEDGLYANAHAIAPMMMGRVLASPKTLLRVGVQHAVECDKCQKETRTRLCPACHYELSHDVGQIDQRIVAIIGGSDTG